MDTLDQDVVNLAKAIRQKESGNRAVIPAEGSKLGGASRYQYTHDTWKETARKYLGDPNAPLSLQNENKATYLKIKDWKDKGYNPAQIASMWNAGEGRPNAYKENWKGTNKYGVAYDTPRYVKSVYDEYQKIKGSQPQRRQPAQPVVPTVAEQRAKLVSEGQPVARNPERVEPTFGGKIARDVLKTPARFLENIKAIPKLIQGQSYEDATSSDSKYFGGKIQGVGTKGGQTNLQNFGSQLKDTAGASLEMASYIPIAGAVGGTANLVKQGVKLSGKQLATQTAKRLAAKRLGLNVVEGAVGNTLFEGGKKLQGELDRESLGKSALYGAGGGLAFGIGGRALTGVVRGARKTAVALGKGGIPQDLAEEATGKLKGAWNEYINDFKDLTSFRDKYKQKTGTNIEDILTREVITPEIKGNKIDLTESMAKNEAKITSSAENVKGLAKAFNDVPVRLSDLERLAIGVVNDTDSILSSGNIIKARKGVKDLFKGLREAYGENINPEIANDIRLAMNRQTKAFTGSVGEMFEQDIANAVGDAVRTKLDEVIQDDVFRRANAEIGELLNVRKFMNKVNGKNVGGGRFSQAFAGIIGSKILGGANNLPMGFGDIIGYVGGKQLQKQANQYAFGKAGPRTRAILRRLENKSAVGKELAEKTANRKQVLLPARTSPVNKAYGSGKTINLPKKAQSTVDAQEIANLSLQKIKKGDYIEVKGNEVEVTLKTDDGIVVKDGNGKREFISKEKLIKGQGEQAFGAVAGLEKDEDGKIKFNKDKALMGVAGMAVAKKAGLMKGANIKSAKLPKSYKGEKDLTTKILKDLEGKTTVSKQYILEATNRGELKQVERDLIRQIAETEGDTINVADFAKKVKAELLPLKRVTQKSVKYENIDLPDELKMPTDKYEEHIYESPIKTSAGKVHGFNTEYYSGHTRTRDLADKKTRQILEIQDDLRQKGNLEREVADRFDPAKTQLSKDKANKLFDYTKRLSGQGENLSTKEITEYRKLFDEAKTLHENIVVASRNKELSKLQQYDNRTSPFRMVREEIKKAAQDGKTKLQFPTGETAMEIEGLGARTAFHETFMNGRRAVDPDTLKIGQEVFQAGQNDAWIITDVLGDGKFKAVQKIYVDMDNPKNWEYSLDNSLVAEGGNPAWMAHNTVTNQREFIQFIPEKKDAALKHLQDRIGAQGKSLAEIGERYAETFDISGKVDTNNPIYRFYEKDVAKYLNKFGGKRVVDDKGVSWIEVPIKKEWAKMPVEAFAFAPLAFLKQDKKEGGNKKRFGLFSNRTIYIAPKENPLLKEKKPLTDETIGKALMQLESSGGTNKRNADPGEMKWLVGLTELAIKELKRLKRIPENFNKNKKEDVIKAGIEYFRLMQERNPEMTPAEVYVDKYWTQWKKLPNPQTARTKKMVEFQNLISVEN